MKSTLRAKGPHVYQSCLPYGSLDLASMRQLAADACQSNKQRARVCCHQNHSDSPQEMIIHLRPRTYIRPHRHFGRAESGLGLFGIAKAVFFSNVGDITDVWTIGNYESGHRFFYRIQEPVFHCLLVNEGSFVFHEVSTGPYAAQNTEYANWTPHEDNANAVDNYLQELELRVKQYTSHY